MKLLLVLILCQLVLAFGAHPLERIDEIYIEDDNGLIYPASELALAKAPTFKLKSDFVFNCWLVLKCLPQGSNDIVDVSKTKDICACAELPDSFFSSKIILDKLGGFMPRFMLLNELDESRYRVFEKHVAPSITDLNWLLATDLQHVQDFQRDTPTDEVLHAFQSRFAKFPNRRVLQTFKNLILTSDQVRDGFSLLLHVTPANMADWEQVFLPLSSPSTKRVVIRHMLSIIVPLCRDDEGFITFMSCYINETDPDLVFYQRFRQCAQTANSHCQLGFQTAILTLRNKLLYEQVFNGADNLDEIQQLFEIYIPDEGNETLLLSSLKEWITTGTHGQKVTKQQWKYLGRLLQTTPALHGIVSRALILAGYFLGHVDLLPEFLVINHELINLFQTDTGGSRQAFRAEHLHTDMLRLVCLALATAAAVDPNFKITSRDFAFASISSANYFDPVSLLYFTEGDDEMLPVLWMEVLYPRWVSFMPVKKSSQALYQRIYGGMNKIRDENLLAVARSIGLQSVLFLEEDRAVRLLQTVLDSCHISEPSNDVMDLISRLFPRIFPIDQTDRITRLLSETWQFTTAPRLQRRLHILAIRHFGLDNPRLCNLFIEYWAKDTLVFVSFFNRVFNQMGENETLVLNQVAAKALAGMRRGLESWLKRRFSVVFTADQTCAITKFPIAKGGC